MICFASKWTSVVVTTSLHFLVDGLCLCCLYLIQPRDAEELLALFLTYNLLAFTTQPLTGWWTDHLRRLHWVLLLSIGLLTTAVILLMVSGQQLQASSLFYWLVAILLGMGNSLFHVWGGKTTVMVAGNDMRALGIFVSTGAAGLVVGMTCAGWWLAAGMLLTMALIGGFAVHIPVSNGKSVPQVSKQPDHESLTYLWLIPILIFVLTRSFLGETLPSNLEKNNALLFVLAATAMVGKAGGGWVARKWGVGTSIVACVGVAAACLLWTISGTNRLPAVLIGVLTINFTMPMTLYLANRVLPEREGAAFGLLAAVLIPGYLFAHMSAPLPFPIDFMLAALLLTISVELGMLRLLGERRRKVFIGAVVLNILTNIPLNLILIWIGSSVTTLAIGELLVLLVETIGYYILVRNWKQSIIYSLLCNATSFLVGALIQLIT